MEEKENISNLLSIELPNIFYDSNQRNDSDLSNIINSGQYFFENSNQNYCFSSFVIQDTIQDNNLNQKIFLSDLCEGKNGNYQSSGFLIKNKTNFVFNMGNLILNKEYSLNEMKNEEKNNKNKTISNFPLERNVFEDYNSNLKCACFQTQCDKYNCECCLSGRFCINCNCKNCNNKPPQNSANDKKINNIYELNIIDKKILCTCTKSGCKNKYCECVKNGQECNDLCGCLKCANSKNPKNINPIFKRLKTRLTNTIKIVNNKISFDDRKKYNKKKLLNKKRKKDKKENVDINFNEELFDENGKIIFTLVTLDDINKYKK